MLAALSTGHEIGLAVVGGIFIVFALVSSFVIPSRKPDFPGEKGFGPFALVTVALFAAMIASVAVFGRESEARGAEKAVAHQGASAGTHTIAVDESEFKIALPSASTLSPGEFVFEVKNVGKVPHDLAIEGGKVTGPSKTPLIAPGKSATLTVSLAQGSYTLYCTVPGHRQAGMVAKLAVQ